MSTNLSTILSDAKLAHKAGAWVEPVPKEKEEEAAVSIVTQAEAPLQPKVEQQSAENHPQPKVEQPQEKKIPEVLTKLRTFLDEEILRLTQVKKTKKGLEDKLALYRSVSDTLNGLLKKPPADISLDDIYNVMNHAAIIAHHRRYTKWNSVASFFNGKYRDAASWRHFTNTFEGKEAPLTAFPNSATRSRTPLRVKKPNTKETLNAKSYNEYRSFIR